LCTAALPSTTDRRSGFTLSTVVDGRRNADFSVSGPKSHSPRRMSRTPGNNAPRRRLFLRRFHGRNRLGLFMSRLSNRGITDLLKGLHSQGIHCVQYGRSRPSIQEACPCPVFPAEPYMRLGTVVSGKRWKFSSSVLRAVRYALDRAARSRGIGGHRLDRLREGLPAIDFVASGFVRRLRSARSRIGPVSGSGSTVCASIRRRTSSFGRSMALAVLAGLHCER